MPLNIDGIRDYSNVVKDTAKGLDANINTSQNSIFNMLAEGIGAACWEDEQKNAQLVNSFFVTKAKDTELDTITDNFGKDNQGVNLIQRIPETNASGVVLVKLVSNQNSVTFLAGTELTLGSQSYLIVDDKIVNNNASFNSLFLVISNQNSLQITTAEPHNLSEGFAINLTLIGDAVYTNYLVDIQVKDQYSFLVPMQLDGNSQPILPTANSGISTYILDGDFLNIKSVQTGIDANIGPNAALSLKIPNEFVESILASVFGIQNAQAQEDDDLFRSRILEIKGGYNAPYTIDDIIFRLNQNFSFITNTQVNNAGVQIDVFPINRKRPNILLFQSEKDEVKAYLDETRGAWQDDNTYNIKDVQTVVINITISQLLPNLQSLQDAINQNLTDYLNTIDFETIVTKESLISTIQTSFDVPNQVEVENFEMLVPASDTIITSGQIAVLGTITYV